MVTEPVSLPAAPTYSGARFLGPPLKASTGHSTFSGVVEVDEWVNVTIQDAKEATSTFEGKETPQIVWLVSIDDQADKGVVAFYTSYSSYDGSGKQPEPSKLFNLFKAVGLTLPPAGERVDVAPAIGKKFRAMFEIKKNKRFATISKVRASKE